MFEQFLPMVREAAEGIVFALTREDVGAESTDPTLFKILDNG
ncbi:hypothetical protein V1289_001999 [Bradyrhizobium sp. AZCC 2289]